MVRARVRRHLEHLKERFLDLLGDADIKEFARTDYAFRIFIAKSTWANILSELAHDTDYDNFKSEVAHHLGTAGADYEHALHRVWSVMYELQR